MSYVETMREFARGEPGGDKVLAGNATVEHVATMLTPFVDELKELRARVAAIEEHGVKYVGVYQAATDYARGLLVTYGGSMWHANVNTRSVPGKDATWTLAVKAGRDA